MELYSPHLTESAKSLLRHNVLNHEIYRSLFQHHLDAIYILDTDGNYIDCNVSTECITGYERNTFLQMSLSELVIEEDIARVQEHFQKALAGMPQQYECTITDKNRNKVHTCVTNVPIIVNDSIIGVYGIAKNVSRMKQTEQLLAQSRERYQSFINHIDVGIFAVNLQNEIVEVNPSLERMTGYTENELIGMTYDDLFFSHELEKVRKLFEGGDYGGLREKREVGVRMKNAVRIEATLTTAPSYVRGKKVGSYAMVRDISEQKRAEKEARDSESKFRLMAEHMNDLIGIVSIDGTILYASPSHKALLGYDPEYLEGNLCISILCEEDIPSIEKKFVEMMQSKAPVECQFRYVDADGQLVTVEGKFQPVAGDDGGVETIVCVVRDIRERVQTEELMRKTEKLSVAGQLAAGIAHEIRNPLTSIKGFVKLMDDELSLERMRERRYFHIMTEELNRIEVILSELLLLAKPQATTYEYRDVLSMLRDVITISEAEAVLKGVQMITNFHQQLPFIKCDNNQLKQVFINLIKNAIESMPHGGTVTIEAEQAGSSHVCIRIIDEGSGIPDELLPKLGEPFYTTKVKGTGLGLMVSFKIIKEHNGTIQYVSKTGEGTTVFILLPSS